MISEIVLATRNKGKIREIKDIMGDKGIAVLSLEDFPGCPEVVEDGASFSENAVKKAKAVCEFTGKPALSDDSGLEVDALGGRPGVHSARFAGETQNPDYNIDKLLFLMKKVPLEESQARFICVAALCLPGGRVETAEGTCEGIICRERKGSNGFGYDPVFLVPEYNMTFAELDIKTKNKISHRAKAFKRITGILLKV